MKYLIYFTLTIFLVASCGINQDVSNGSWIQKRKYTKGFHISKKSNHNDKKNIKLNNDPQTEMAINESKKQKKHASLDKKAETKKITKSSEHSNIEEANTISNEQTASTVDFHSTQENSKSFFENKETEKLDSRSFESFVTRVSDKYYGSLGVDDNKVDEDIKLIIAIILCLVALSPLGVYIMKGSGSDFTLNLLLWIIAVVLGIFRAAIWTGFGFGYGLAGLVMLIAVVHGILVILDLM